MLSNYAKIAVFMMSLKAQKLRLGLRASMKLDDYETDCKSQTEKTNSC